MCNYAGQGYDTNALYGSMLNIGRVQPRISAERVVLNVYDLNPQNDALIYLGLGVFHSGVEVYGNEYTFGSGSGSGTGVFSHAPKGAPNVPLRATIILGEVSASPREVEQLVNSLKPEWQGRSYSLVMRNCNHFADELVIRLLGARIPGESTTAAVLGLGRQGRWC